MLIKLNKNIINYKKEIFSIMKNIVKKLFSLLLVGVVAISMFSFVAPTNAEAAEADSYGTLSIRNWASFTARFHVTFYDSCGKNLGEHDTGKLEGWGFRHSRDFKIPKLTYHVQVFMDVMWGNDKTIDFYVDKSTVNEKSRIELISEGAVDWWGGKEGGERFTVETCNGWIEDPQKRGNIYLNNMLYEHAKTGEYFKVKFFSDSQKGQLGEQRVHLFYPKMNFKIPDYTSRITVEVYQGDHLHTAYLKLCRNKTFSTDNIYIELKNMEGWRTPIHIAYSDSWQRVL